MLGDDGCLLLVGLVVGVGKDVGPECIPTPGREVHVLAHKGAVLEIVEIVVAAVGRSTTICGMEYSTTRTTKRMKMNYYYHVMRRIQVQVIRIKYPHLRRRRRRPIVPWRWSDILVQHQLLLLTMMTVQ